MLQKHFRHVLRMNTNIIQMKSYFVDVILTIWHLWLFCYTVVPKIRLFFLFENTIQFSEVVEERVCLLHTTFQWKLWEMYSALIENALVVVFCLLLFTCFVYFINIWYWQWICSCPFKMHICSKQVSAGLSMSLSSDFTPADSTLSTIIWPKKWNEN